MSETTSTAEPDLLADAVECFDHGRLDACLEHIVQLKAGLAPEDPPADAFYFEALCYRRKGDLGRALATMARAVEMAPEEADVLLEHGLIMIESGRVQEGL
ncbi:MAG: hypothetical protein FJX76_22215, partial [Armatimonadetes bacterium]|nr:hypothetical protein [Armatimonadota bacterium]